MPTLAILISTSKALNPGYRNYPATVGQNNAGVSVGKDYMFSRRQVAQIGRGQGWNVIVLEKYQGRVLNRADGRLRGLRQTGANRGKPVCDVEMTNLQPVLPPQPLPNGRKFNRCGVVIW